MAIKGSSTRLGLCVAIVILGSSAARAFAQADPEAGDLDTPAASDTGAKSGSSFSASGQVSTHQATDSESASLPRARPLTVPAAASATPGDSPNDDHSAAVGSFGVGFFGVMTVPIMDCGSTPMYPPCAPTNGDAPAPTIGLRYWVSDFMGLEAGLGLRVASGSFGPPRNEDSSQFAVSVHGGVPLALAHAGHFVFELVPQLNFGVASGSITGSGGNGMAIKSTVSGLLLEAGAKVGAEVHFGFMGLPQLSLQGTLGLMVHYEHRSATAPNPNGMGSSTTAQKETSIATGVDGTPWDIFRSAITAIYYFD